MSATDIQEAMNKLSLADGDVVFCDSAVVDFAALSNSAWPPVAATFIAVRCRPGQSVSDAICRMSKEEAVVALKAVTKGDSQ